MTDNYQFKLTVHPPQGAPWPFALTNENITIGRLANNDLMLPDDRVSRTHAVLTRRGDLFQLSDKHSANGTSLNGKEMPKGGIRTLKDGDEIQIGDHRLVYQVTAIADDDAPLAGGTMQLQNAADLLRLALSSGGSLSSATTSLSAIMKRGTPPPSMKQDESQIELELLRKRSQMLGFMYELNKTLSTAFSVESIFERVAEQIFLVTSADRVIFTSADVDDVRINWMGHGKDQVSAAFQNTAISRSVIKKVLKEHVSILSNDPLLDQNLQGSKTFALGIIKSLMCAPLLVQEDQVLGAIYLDSSKLMAFSQEDINFLTAVASITAISIEKIGAHDKLLLEAQARTTYQRFLPPFVIEQIMKDPDSLELGGANQTVTMLFADIRGFTSLSERKTPREMVQMLNRYFDMAANEIYQHKGTLDKFIGDGIMALFGAPKPSDDDIVNAVRTAIGLQKISKALNEDMQREGADFMLNIGIGINTGDVIAGYIGSKLRTDYTVIGDAVNLAARLESRAEPGQVLMGEHTFQQLRHYTLTNNLGVAEEQKISIYREDDKEKFEFTVVQSGPMQVKGKVNAVMVYRVYWDS